MPTVKIADHQIGDGQKSLIVAEIGINHNGEEELAHKMVDAIADGGADCVKFQTFTAADFMNGADQRFEYLSQGKLVTESMLAMFQRHELAAEAFFKLYDHACERGLVPLSTPTDPQAVDLLDKIGFPAFKIGSDDIVHTPFLKYVARKNKPMIISTGMADKADVSRAANVISDTGNEDLIILHCVSLYPTPDENVNLSRIMSLKNDFPHPIGFSDHSDGITAAIGATMIGACLIEKHFTLDRNLPGPDHHFSSDPSEFANLVKEVRRLETQIGGSARDPVIAEKDMAAIARRSIVINRDVPADHVLSDEDLSYRRPGTGLMPYERDNVIGRRTRQPIVKGTLLSFSMLD